MELSDYAQALGAAQQLVPSWDEPDRRRAELQGQQVQNQVGQQQVLLGQQQVIASQQAVAEHRQSLDDGLAFKADVAALSKNATADQYRALALKHPHYFEPIKNVADAMDTSHKQQTISDLAQIGSAIVAKQPQLAATRVQRHIDADKAAGKQPDPDDVALVEMLNSGDAEKIKGAGAMVHGYLAALDDKAAKATGPDDTNHFSSTGDGAVYDQRTGAITRDAPAKDNNAIQVPIYDADGHRIGTQLVANGGRGGDPASGGGGASTRFSPAASSVASALSESGLPATVVAGFMGNFHVEGGYDGAQGDGGSASGIAQWHSDRAATFERIIGKPVTQASHTEQAKFVAWEMQNPQAAGMTVQQRDAILAAKTPAQAAALIDKYYERSSGRDRKVRMSAATAFSSDVGRGDGQASASASGAQPGYFGPVAGKGGNAAGNDSVGSTYLNSLPAGRKAIVQSILDGKMAAPKPGSRFGEALAEDVARVNPGFDPSIQPARMQTRKDFTGSGKAAMALASFNRFGAHLNSAWENHLKLSGPNLGVLSGVAASTLQSFEPGRVSSYNTEIDGIQGEFQKLTKMGVANEGEANRLIHAARAAQSSEGRAGALRAMANLVAGAYSPLKQQWHSAFPDQGLPVDVTDGTRAVIRNILGGGGAALPIDKEGAPYDPRPTRIATNPKTGRRLGLVNNKWIPLK